jgi:succinyl-diaminopimelate desuccinylase
VHGQRGHPAAPALDDLAAAALLRGAAASADAAWPETPPTSIEVTTRWPPYALPDGSPLRDALLQAAQSAGLTPVAKVVGAVKYRQLPGRAGHPCYRRVRRGLPGLHGTDERIRLDSIPAVQAAYHQGLLTLLHAA